MNPCVRIRPHLCEIISLDCILLFMDTVKVSSRVRTIACRTYRLGHASVETLRKLGFHGDYDDCHICPQGKLKHSKFARRTSYAQHLLERVHSDVMGPFIEGYWGEKYCLLFIDEMSRKAFIKTLKSRSEVAAATLELIKKEQRRT